MAASEIHPQMANFQTFYRTAFYFFLAAETAHFAHWYFVLNFSRSAQKQHILVFRNTPNCSSVHSGMTRISLAESALHNRYAMATKDFKTSYTKKYSYHFTSDKQVCLFSKICTLQISWHVVSWRRSCKTKSLVRLWREISRDNGGTDRRNRGNSKEITISQSAVRLFVFVGQMGGHSAG